jgi:peptide/nickel transport system substrate-binding protein
MQGLLIYLNKCRLPLFLLATLSLFQLTGCSPEPERPAGTPSIGEVPGGAELTAEPVTGDWLVRRLQAEPDTLNFITSTDAYSSEIQAEVFETLIIRDPRTLEYAPLLAESWEESDDHLQYTFKIREGVKWHNGEPLTAEDFIFSYNTMMNPAVRSAHLKGYYKDVEGIEKIDEFTIRFTMKEPYALALEKLGALPVVPKSVYGPDIETEEALTSTDFARAFNDHEMNRHPIGTGPYKFQQWKTNSEIVLERDPQWWGYEAGRPAYVDRIIFKISTDSTTALQQLQAGQLDMMNRFEKTQWVRQLDTPRFKEQFNKYEFYTPSYSYIGWNSLKPYFADSRVRRAMTHLVDREKFVEKVLFGLGTVVSSNFFFKSPYSSPEIEPWPYNPAEAVRLLDEAGWVDSNGDGIRDKDGVKFSFTFKLPADSKNGQRIAALLQEELEKIGIEMKIQSLEWATYLQDIQKKDFDCCAMSWSMPWSVDLYQIWHSDSAGEQGSNYVSFKNEEADEIVIALRRTFDEQKRIELCHRFHEIVHEEQPYTFMYASAETMAVDKRFRGVETFPIRPGFIMDEWWVPKAEQRYP